MPNIWHGFQFNPRYKMRVWDGKFRAYNIKTHILPYGLVKDLIKWCVAQGTTFQLEGFHDTELYEQLDENNYQAQIKDNMKNAPFEIRDYQDRAVRAALTNHKGILLSCTSSGKSLMIYNIIRCIRKQNYKNILLIVPNIMLVDQMYDDFTDYGYEDMEHEVERLGGGHEAYFDKPVLISTWQSLQNKENDFFEKYDALFVDECVSEKTLIRTPFGDKKITEIRKGDLVVSYNIEKNIFENKKVLDTFINHTSSKSAKMYRIELENGRKIELTGNHPVYTTNRGWVKAENLTEQDDIKLDEYNLLDNITYLDENKQKELKEIYEKYIEMDAFNRIPILDKALYEKYYKNNADLLYSLRYKISGMKGGIMLGKSGTAKGRKSWAKGLTKFTNKSIAKTCEKLSKHNKDNDPRLQKFSKNRSGQNNPMSATNYKKDRTKINKLKSDTIKTLILEGKYTPKTENRLNHKKLEYNGIKYRSSWEIIFHYLNPTMLYETIRIPYTLKNGETHIYISDFYDNKTNTIYEIKPDKIYKDLYEKMKAIEDSIKYNTDYNFVHLGDAWVKSVILPESCDIPENIINMFKAGIKYYENKEN